MDMIIFAALIVAVIGVAAALLLARSLRECSICEGKGFWADYYGGKHECRFCGGAGLI